MTDARDSSEGETQHCRICVEEQGKRIVESPEFDLSTASGYDDLLRHVLSEHPETWQEMFSGGTVRLKCEECGTIFDATIHYGEDGFTADAFCAECVEDDPIRKLVVSALPTENILRREVNLNAA